MNPDAAKTSAACQLGTRSFDCIDAYGWREYTDRFLWSQLIGNRPCLLTVRHVQMGVEREQGGQGS